MRTSNSTRLFSSLLLLTLFAAIAASAQIAPAGDAYTNTADANTNYGAATVLDVKSATQTTYIQFNLSSIPESYTGANIAQATLKLYVNAVTTAGSFNVDYVNGTWAEGTIDADHAPALGPNIAASVPLTAADKNQYILINVTAAVQAWLNGAQPDDGIALVANSPLNASFDSKENTTTSHPAELDIVFTGAGPQGPQGAVGVAGPAGAQGLQGSIGAMGATGAQGPAGFMGAQGAQGAPGTAGTNGTGFNFTGPFSNSISYNINDVASYNGSTYVTTVANQGAGTPDTNPTDWALMAQQGVAGAAGSQGPAGATGPQGPTGATGTQGPSGLTGVTGAQGSTGLPGAPGPQGATGATGPAGVAGNTAAQVALLQWWSSTYPAGNNPYGVAFDGTNIWVTEEFSNSVTKLLASTGAVVGSYGVGTNPQGLAFDGTNIWVTNQSSNNVTELLASTGAVVGTYAVGSYPQGVAFDGTNIWVANEFSDTVTELLASTGAVVGTYSAGNTPVGVAFDGLNIWVTNEYSYTVTKLVASTGAVVGTYPVGIYPTYVAFDGTNIWVVNTGNNSGSVYKLLASTGAQLGLYYVGSSYSHPYGVAFDGTNIWVANSSSNTVTRIPAY